MYTFCMPINFSYRHDKTPNDLGLFFRTARKQRPGEAASFSPALQGREKVGVALMRKEKQDDSLRPRRKKVRSGDCLGLRNSSS